MKFCIIPSAMGCNDAESILPYKTLTSLGSSLRISTPATLTAILPNWAFVGLKNSNSPFDRLQMDGSSRSTYLTTFSTQSLSIWHARFRSSSSINAITLIVMCNLFAGMNMESFNPNIGGPPIMSRWKWFNVRCLVFCLRSQWGN